jgi:hypothetical protein
MWPAIKKDFSQEAFRSYVKSLTFNQWRPTKIVWHNTAAPTLKQWIKSADEDARNGKAPGISRIQSLERFFKDNNGWSGCPHLFIANDRIWVMNPLTAPGVHSPSWNGTSIGIEMIGDFSVEDDDFGEGLKVKNSTIHATAVLCSALGIDPKTQIFLHKQDPKTTHDCPGEHIARDKQPMIESVIDLMDGGEHHPQNEEAPQVAERAVVTTADNLNFRIGPSVLSEARSQLPKGVNLTVLDSATGWLKVKTPAGYIGWVAGRYTQEV